MSRDWTPRETLAAEQISIAEGRGTYFDFLRNSFWHINGEKVPLCKEEDVALREQYPLLGKLFDPFVDLHKKLSTIDGGLDLLSLKEEELQAYTDRGAGKRDSYLIRWFNGELDESFYYRERNNEAFFELVLNEAKALEHISDEKHSALQDVIKGAESRTSQSNTKQTPTPEPER